MFACGFQLPGVPECEETDDRGAMAGPNDLLTFRADDRPNVIDCGAKVKVGLAPADENASPDNPQKLISEISKAD